MFIISKTLKVFNVIRNFRLTIQYVMIIISKFPAIILKIKTKNDDNK